MITRKKARLGRDGFTMIEVMIAFLILAIGLLSLQALAIGSSRMISRAERLGEYQAIATTEVENNLRIIRDAATPIARTSVQTYRNATVRTETTQAGRNWTVTVTVTPTGNTGVVKQNEPFVLVGNVFK